MRHSMWNFVSAGRVLDALQSLLRLVVVFGGDKGHFHDLSLNDLLSNSQAQLCPSFGEGPGYVGHGDVAAQSGARAAGGHGTNAVTVMDEYLGPRPGRRPLGGGETHPPPCWFVCQLLENDATAEKASLRAATFAWEGDREKKPLPIKKRCVDTATATTDPSRS